MRTARQADPDPQGSLQACVDRALQDLLPTLTGLRVQPFGSRVYDAAGPKSDYDFYLELPKNDAAQAKVFRACIRQHLIDAGVTSWSKSHDQLPNNTLKWTTLQQNLHVSINVGEQGSMGHAVLNTRFLQQFFRQHAGLRDSAMRVAETLRDAKQMMTEGAVGDTLKSAPFFFLCAALHCQTDCSEPGKLFQQIVQFPASHFEIAIHLSALAHTEQRSHADAAVATRAAADAVDFRRAISFVRRMQYRRTDTLVIVVTYESDRRNIAQKVSEPRFALIQHICATAIGIQDFLPRSIEANDFDFNSLSGNSRHLVYDTWTSTTYPAVTNIWKTRGARTGDVRVLVILTGNGNDRYIHSDAYDFLLCVTWGSNHETNPEWLPPYLLKIADAASACEGGLGAIDVLGISRGHCALMASCQCSPLKLHMHLAARYRHFLVGGGCIWQRQDA